MSSRKKSPKKVIVLLALMLAIAAAPVAAQQAGGGLSFFIPESLLYLGEGTVSIETALETSLSFGDVIGVPIGVAYNQVYGLVPHGDSSPGFSRPWFYADSLIPFIGLDITIPIDRFYIKAIGAGAGNWNITLRPLTKNIEQDLAGPGRVWSFASEPDFRNTFGLGFIAGGEFGVNFDAFSININAVFRDIRHNAPLEAPVTYYLTDIDTGTTTEQSYTNENLRIRLRGLAIGVGGSIPLP